MSTINKVLIGFASMVCTAVMFSAAVSPAIGVARQERTQVQVSSSARIVSWRDVAAFPKRRASAGTYACTSQLGQPAV